MTEETTEQPREATRFRSSSSDFLTPSSTNSAQVLLCRTFPNVRNCVAVCEGSQSVRICPSGKSGMLDEDEYGALVE
jgi:hypothetical protein